MKEERGRDCVWCNFAVIFTIKKGIYSSVIVIMIIWGNMVLSLNTLLLLVSAWLISHNCEHDHAFYTCTHPPHLYCTNLSIPIPSYRFPSFLPWRKTSNRGDSSKFYVGAFSSMVRVTPRTMRFVQLSSPRTS